MQGLEGLAENFGIRSCWSLPIIGSNGDVLGTFAMYCGDARTPRGGMCGRDVPKHHDGPADGK